MDGLVVRSRGGVYGSGGHAGVATETHARVEDDEEDDS